MASDSTIFTLPSADVKAGILPSGNFERNSGVWFVLPSSKGAKVRIRLLRLAAAWIWFFFFFFVSGVGCGRKRGRLLW